MKRFLIIFAGLLVLTLLLVGFHEFIRNVALAVTIALILRVANEYVD